MLLTTLVMTSVFLLCLLALLEKLLKREKKTRRLLQRQLSSVGVGNLGDGSDGLQRPRARSPDDDDDDDDGKLKASSANEIPVSAFQTTGLS